MDGLCWDDVDAEGHELDDPLAELEQDVYHAIFEVVGSNLDDTERGEGIEDILSGVLDPNFKRRLSAGLLRDDRIESVDVAVTQVGADSFRLDVAIQPQGSIALLINKTGIRPA